MKIIFISDIVGEPGRDVLKHVLSDLVKNIKFDFIIANAENAAGGKGITKSVADEIFSTGVNVITLGNHTWERKEIEQIIDDPRILRPANYPEGDPGKGWNIYTISDNIKIAVINLMGRVYMPLLDCPFRTADKIIKSLNYETKNIFVDFHAEITSEKQAMGWYLDGRVSAVVGTHTHVQTNDAKVLDNGTAYLTDCGMCGSADGIIGMDREIIIKKYLTSIPYKFNIAKGDMIFNACIIDIDNISGKSLSIEPINIHIKKDKI